MVSLETKKVMHEFLNVHLGIFSQSSLRIIYLQMQYVQSFYQAIISLWSRLQLTEPSKALISKLNSRYSLLPKCISVYFSPFDLSAHLCFLFIGVINSIKLSKDDNYLISGAEDKCIKVFSVREKQELHNFSDVHTGMIIVLLLLIILCTIDIINTVTISQDNTFILSVSTDTTIQRLDLQPKQELCNFMGDSHLSFYSLFVISLTLRYRWSQSCTNITRQQVYCLRIARQIYHDLGYRE